jgi:hypothetical protein
MKKKYFELVKDRHEKKQQPTFLKIFLSLHLSARYTRKEIYGAEN